jgi:hypothetical protein
MPHEVVQQSNPGSSRITGGKRIIVVMGATDQITPLLKQGPAPGQRDLRVYREAQGPKQTMTAEEVDRKFTAMTMH